MVHVHLCSPTNMLLLTCINSHAPRTCCALGNSPTLKELGEELLDKACVGDVAAIKYLVAVGADPNFVDLEPGHMYACVSMRVCVCARVGAPVCIREMTHGSSWAWSHVMHALMTDV